MSPVQVLCFQLEVRRNLVQWLERRESLQILQREDGFQQEWPTVSLPVAELAHEAVPSMAEGGKVRRVRVLTTRMLDEDDLLRLFGDNSIGARLNGATITGWKLVANGDNPWPLHARVYVRLFQFGRANPQPDQVPRVTMAVFLWYQASA